MGTNITESYKRNIQQVGTKGACRPWNNQLPQAARCCGHPQCVLQSVCVQIKEPSVYRGNGGKINPEVNNKIYFTLVNHSVIWALKYIVLP